MRFSISLAIIGISGYSQLVLIPAAVSSSTHLLIHLVSGAPLYHFLFHPHIRSLSKQIFGTQFLSVPLYCFLSAQYISKPEVQLENCSADFFGNDNSVPRPGQKIPVLFFLPDCAEVPHKVLRTLYTPLFFACIIRLSSNLKPFSEVLCSTITSVLFFLGCRFRAAYKSTCF